MPSKNHMKMPTSRKSGKRRMSVLSTMSVLPARKLSITSLNNGYVTPYKMIAATKLNIRFSSVLTWPFEFIS